MAEPFEKVSCRKHGEVLLSIQNWNLQDGSGLIIQLLATGRGKSEVGASGWAKRGSKMSFSSVKMVTTWAKMVKFRHQPASKNQEDQCFVKVFRRFLKDSHKICVVVSCS